MANANHPADPARRTLLAAGGVALVGLEPSFAHAQGSQPTDAEIKNAVSTLATEENITEYFSGKKFGSLRRYTPQFFLVDKTQAPKNILSFIWSVSCPDSLVAYTFLLKPLLAEIQRRSLLISFFAVARNDGDLSRMRTLMAADPSKFDMLCLCFLAASVKSGGPLNNQQTTRLVSHLKIQRDNSFNSDLATQVLTEQHDALKKILRLSETPTVHLNGVNLDWRKETPDSVKRKLKI
jgi:hypothetical protein